MRIVGPSGTSGDVLRAATTDFQGKARFESVSPGDYYLSAEHLGISAAYHCFHVASGTSFFAKRKQAYKWGDWSTAVRAVTGTLIDRRLGTGGTLLWNISHSVSKPIAGSLLRLHSFETGAIREAMSDDSGNFDFGPLREGLYVLHAVARTAEPSYDESHSLLRVHPGATKGFVTLTHTPFSAGRCDDSLDPTWK